MPNIEIYSSTFCPYCIRAKSLFKKKGLAFAEYNIETDPARHNEMLKRSQGVRTVPQIFINNRHVGGCDELYALERSKELDNWLKPTV